MEASCAPRLHESTTGLEISSGDLVLAGPVDDVWMFQIASTLTTTEGRQVILIGGAQAPNVFLHLGTSAALVTNPMFKGSRKADQSVTLITGPTQDGGALTRICEVALDCGTVEESGGDVEWQ